VAYSHGGEWEYVSRTFFPKDQFWESFKSDERSVTLWMGVPLIAFDYIYDLCSYTDRTITIAAAPFLGRQADDTDKLLN